MTTIDGVPGRWRPWLPGVAQAPAEALAAAEGCTVPELVAQLILDAHAKIATDAATSSAGAVDPGQGTAASTPAPTIVPVIADGAVGYTTLPPACDTCGERSEHEVCS